MGINPYSDFDKLGWEMVEVEFGIRCYDFDTLCFWKVKNGDVYAEYDSGCSCPAPFERYESEDEQGVLQKLQKVGTLDMAYKIYRSLSDDRKPNKSWDEIEKTLKVWMDGKK